MNIKFVNKWYFIYIGTDWAGGVYKVLMTFPDEYPSKVINLVMITNYN